MKPQRSRSWLRWAAVPLLVGVAIWLLVPTGPQSDARRTLSASRAETNAQSPASSGASATNRSVRDWDSWATDVASFTAADFQALVEDALAIADPERRSAILADILTAWLKLDARSFNKYFMALEVAGEAGKLDSLVGSLKAALASLADNIPSSQTLQEIVRRMIARLARADPKDALAWATTWLRGDTRDSALVQILARWRCAIQRRPGRKLAASRRPCGGCRLWRPSVGHGQTARVGRRRRGLRSSRLRRARNGAEFCFPGDCAEQSNRSRQPAGRGVEIDGGRVQPEISCPTRRVQSTEVDVLNDREAYRDLLNDGALPPPTARMWN